MKHHYFVGLIFILGLSGCSSGPMSHQTEPIVALEIPAAPAALRTQPGQKLTLIAKGTGVQIYTCGISKTDPSKYDWLFKAPEADLLNVNGKTIGKHYAGPSWEADDGSKVVGQVKASVSDPDGKSIASLLLNVVSNSGAGVFAKTTSIQRLYPAGGKAPLDGCDQDHLGKEARVSYTAQYYFYD